MLERLVKYIVSTEAQNNFGRLIDDVSTAGTCYVIRRHGKPKAVMISIADFEKLLLTERGGEKLAKVLRESRAEYELGEKAEIS